MKLLRELLSRRWIGPTIAVLLGMAIMFRLGIWQLDRLQERRAANEELRQTLAAAPLQLTADFTTGDWEALKDRAVTVRGEYDMAHEVVLLVQNWQGRAGVNLITPLVLADGKTAVLIDRGWIPAAAASVADRQQFAIDGEVEVSGVIALTQIIPRQGSIIPDEPQAEWYRVDVEAIAAQLPYRVLPVYVQQVPPPAGGTVELPYQPQPEIDLSEGPHLSYAIQWFMFTGLLALIYTVLVNQRMSATDEPANAD